MKKIMLMMAIMFATLTTASAQNGSNRISLGAGLLYERGMDLTLSYEHETNYHIPSCVAPAGITHLTLRGPPVMGKLLWFMLPPVARQWPA